MNASYNWVDLLQDSSPLSFNRAHLLLLHPFNDLFSRTTWVSRYLKGKTSLDLNKARADGVVRCSSISWTICKQSAPRHRPITHQHLITQFFTGRMLFLVPNQQCQSTEGKRFNRTHVYCQAYLPHTLGSFRISC